MDKINQFLVPQDTVAKGKNEPRKTIDSSRCVLEKNLLSSSQRAQVSENQTKAPIIRLAELQQKFKYQPQRVPVVKVKEFIDKLGSFN